MQRVRAIFTAQGLHSQILIMEGGQVQQRFIFYTQKDHNFRICLPKKITTFLSIPKKKSLSSFFATHLRPKKISTSFIDPKKKYFWPKISNPKKSLGAPPPPLSLKYVSGAPGIHSLALIFISFLIYVYFLGIINMTQFPLAVLFSLLIYMWAWCYR